MSNTRQVLVVHVCYLVAGVDSPLCGCSTPCTGRQRGADYNSRRSGTKQSDRGGKLFIGEAAGANVGYH